MRPESSVLPCSRSAATCTFDEKNNTVLDLCVSRAIDAEDAVGSMAGWLAVMECFGFFFTFHDLLTLESFLN